MTELQVPQSRTLFFGLVQIKLLTSILSLSDYLNQTQEKVAHLKGD